MAVPAVRKQGPAVDRRAWGLVFAASSLLALFPASLASDATTVSRADGEASPLLAVRWTISVLLNGTLWAAPRILER